MTYNEIIETITRDETGIAKGYSISFLQDEFMYLKSKKELENLIATDLKLFKEIEKALTHNKIPQEGDFVEYKKGRFARISRLREDGNIQLSNSIGVYVSKHGTSQASGCTWDPEVEYEDIKISSLTISGETKKGSCWMFSQGLSGKDRGVYFEIDYKIWNLK